MKLLSLAILLSSIIFTFNYVWINRIDISNLSGWNVLLNKWTGNHCVLLIKKENRENHDEDDYKLCSVNENGKIEFP